MNSSAILRRPRALVALIVVLIFQAVSAIPPGAMLVISPSGELLHLPHSHLDGSPFPSFVVPGLVLSLVLGVLPALAATGLIRRWEAGPLARLNPFRRYTWAWTLSLVVGVGLLIWIGVEVIWVPYTFLQPLYAAVGLAIVVLTFMPSVRAACRRPAGP